MTIRQTFDEINKITGSLISHGLTVVENFPVINGNLISWTGQSDLSIALKNISYREKYLEYSKNNNFNFKLLDGALVQMLFEFDSRGRNLISHRLLFFPSPDLERYEQNPNDYEELFFGNSEFHDIIEKYIVTSPIRLDYSVDSNKFKEIHHPYCHLHIGEYETCRIPIKSPITPNVFINFILRNFYNTAITELCGNLTFPTSYFQEVTITTKEGRNIHLNIT